MPRSLRALTAEIGERIDDRWPGVRRRATGLGLALAIEGGIIALLLTLGVASHRQAEMSETLVSVAFGPDKAKDTPKPREPEKTAKSAPRVASNTPVVPQPTPPQPQAVPIPNPAPTTPPAALIPLTRDQMAGSNISNIKPKLPTGPPDRSMGPPNTGSSGDTPRVGTTAGGQPLYAAAWYREPYPDELNGYLSTASSPGWALINCQTVRNYRVENCVLEDEWPNGAGIGRAVLAAAWQFRVRPPRVGGVSQVGDWVRIRITYQNKRG
ncbi:hypothetical protein IDJ81_06600 [Tsuneonella flava]|uniref:Protein TonB n=1 Tax=Tsuneonella flava TaxID=2055955 RepID=A0ABX7KE17_9SPHN|nr:hypothetical protein [Tsuneonella flava]QSB45757.1 hypothetical protein IDJ81_06600 [Tsuneonella flava]